MTEKDKKDLLHLFFKENLSNEKSYQENFRYIEIKINKKLRYDCYYGIRKVGKFFAYNQKAVSIYLTNNSSNSKRKIRDLSRGFFVTIKTIDDAALYLDFKEPITEEQLEAVFYYFDKPLQEDKDIVKDLERLLNTKCVQWDNS